MHSRVFRTLLVVVVFLFFGGTAIHFWHHQNRDERELVLRHTKTSAEQSVARMEGLMKARMTALRLLADRWVERMPPDFRRERFLQFAEDIYRHYPGFEAINWIDPQGVIQWLFPEKNNMQTRGKSIRRDPFYKEIFQEADKARPVVVTSCAPSNGQGFVFEAFIPLFHEQALQGYLEGAFQVNRIMSICLAEGVFKDFKVRLYESDKLIYANEEPDTSLGGNRLSVTREIRFPGKTWKLNLEPRSRLFSPNLVPNVSFLVFALAASAILSLLLLFLLQRMSMYKEARDQAFHEIEERKQAQKALQVNEKELERLLLELARNNEELETFVYIVSHDLKTPIVTIEGFIGALREDFGDLISKDGEKYLSYMSDATRKMEMLINDLLELSRIGRLSEKKGEFPFGQVVQEALSTLQVLIRERGIQMDIQKDLPVVYGERKRLVQVMENLLSNAVKYMGEDNPSPRIQVGVQREGNQDLFFVRDNGIGIDRRHFEKIFQVFRRLRSAKERGEGTGVGLTIVKQIVERAGGRIWVESEAGKGSTFFFTLKDKEV